MVARLLPIESVPDRYDRYYEALQRLPCLLEVCRLLSDHFQSLDHLFLVDVCVDMHLLEFKEVIEQSVSLFARQRDIFIR